MNPFDASTKQSLKISPSDPSPPLILVVDDEPINCRMLEAYLVKNGFQVLVANSGQASLALAAEHQPDLILLDIMMPGLDGFSVCRQLKAQSDTRDIPVIFLSALTEPKEKTRAFDSGGVDYVSKPFDIMELSARVRTHLTLRAQEIQLRQYANHLEDMVAERTQQLQQAQQVLQHNYDMQKALNHLLSFTLQELPLARLMQCCLESILQVPWLAGPNCGALYLQEAPGGSMGLVAHHNMTTADLARSTALASGPPCCDHSIQNKPVMLVRSDDLPAELASREFCPYDHICVPVTSRSTTVLLILYVNPDVVLTSQETEFLQAVAHILTQMMLHSRAEAQMLHNLHHDSLTRLPNRVALLEMLATENRRLAEDTTCQFALLLLNLDGFNRFNDSFGFELGNELLTTTAARLRAERDTDEEVLHLGGDEFALLLRNQTDVRQVLRVAEDVLNCIRKPFEIESHQLQISGSIGIVHAQTPCLSSEDWLRDASTAAHQAKFQGRDRFVMFTEAMHQKAWQSMRMFMDLRLALQREEFTIHYQPVIRLKTGRAVGVEALVRWQHPERGLVSPGAFIPVAEETGLIRPLGHWILKQACRNMQAFAAEMRPVEFVMLSVNLSGKQFAQEDLFEQIVAVLEKTQFPAHCLKLEITESVIMDNAEAAVKILKRFKALGVRIAIDDFGTGYSSLSYLHRFPVDVLKVDRSFVNRMYLDGENLEIVRTIITLAHTLKMEVIAEGVETQAEAAVLERMGCEFAQGFYFARPMPLAELGGCGLWQDCPVATQNQKEG